MKILVTGATGFIGRHFVNDLLSTENNVICVVRDAEKLDVSKTASANITVIQGDLADKKTYSLLPKDIDAVVHLAASLGAWNAKVPPMLRNNVFVTELLLEWFKQTDGIHFLFISTPGVQGLGRKLAKETDPYNPRGPYEMSKVLAERKVVQFGYHENQSWTILRPDFVYGPGDYRRIPLYRRIMKRHWFHIGDGESVVRPTYVCDVTQAIQMCIGHDSAFRQVFNIAGPDLISIENFASTIAGLFNVTIPSLRMPVGMLTALGSILEAAARISRTRPLMTRSQVEFLTQDHGTDIRKINEHLEFSPRIGFTEGMRRTIKWACKEKLL